ncbi:hypothetical protein FHS92_000008 [Sphingobium subterraneum]|uniref:Transposase n=1 Tax=Sphingobium subterraneum TaxID=627688 RepID=A0A841J1U8_9SPHN|nr:hypothetical protein [Sphingobium subterraneum]
MNTKLHAVTDANGRPKSFFMTAAQVSGYTGAAAFLDNSPGHDGYWQTGDNAGSFVRPCMKKLSGPPSQTGSPRTKPSNTTSAETGSRLCLVVLKRFDRCPIAFLSAIALEAIVIFWL